MISFAYGLLHGVVASSFQAGGAPGSGFSYEWGGSAVDGTNTTSYSFASHPVGTPSATRKVLIGVSSWDDATGPLPSGVTVGGNAATFVSGGAISSQGGALSWWIIDLASGTTATVAVTFSGAQTRCSISTWAIDPASDPLYLHNVGLTGSDGAAAVTVRGVGAYFHKSISVLSVNYRSYSADYEYTTTEVEHSVTWSAGTPTGATLQSDDFVEAGAGIGSYNYSDALALGTSTPYYLYCGSGQDAANLSTYTFSNILFGTAEATRRIVVGIHSDGNGVYPTGVTIGGVAASMLSSYTANTESLSFWVASVPSGVSGSVVITYASSRGRCGMAAWAFYNAGISVYDSATAPNSTAVTLDIPTNGAVLAVCGAVVSANRRFGAADKLVVAGETARSVSYGGSWSGVTTRRNNNYGESTLGNTNTSLYISLACL